MPITGTPDPAVRLTFVGAGPGDPRLLTLAAADTLRSAALVLADTPALVDLLDDERLGLGGDVEVREVASADAAERVAEALRAGADGRRVVRLVEGDPFIDGSARTEASLALADGIEVDVVPGLSQRTTAAEYAGVDLSGAPLSLVRAEELPVHLEVVPGNSQLVSTTGDLAPAVIAHALGQRTPDEPAVVVLRGGSTTQLTLRAPLSKLGAMLDDDLQPDDSVTLVLGPAAGSDPTAWFESKPLFGWRVLVPRTKEQSASLVSRLAAHGAHAEEVPTIAVEPPRQPHLVDRAIRSLVEGSFEWVVFTSVNAVRAVREKVEEYGLDARVFSGVRVAVVGNSTRAALMEWGITPDLMPEGEHSAAGLAAEFPVYDDLLDPINRVFLPRADIAVDTLVTGLADLGWDVEDVTAYRTVRALPPPVATREAIKSGDFDAVVFTSSSTVRNLVGIAGKPHACTVIAAIGPRTAETCREHGLRVDVMASEPDVLVLVDELSDFARQRRDALVASGKPVKKPSQRRRRRRSVPVEAGDGHAHPSPDAGEGPDAGVVPGDEAQS